jgi:hypothetical protein
MDDGHVRVDEQFLVDLGLKFRFQGLRLRVRGSGFCVLGLR